MKSSRVLVVIIAVLSLFSIMSITFAIAQREQAMKWHHVAKENEKAAVAAKEEAERQAQMARQVELLASQQAAIAAENARVAQTALEDCRKRK